jgi:ATP-binding cassette subfamily B protein
MKELRRLLPLARPYWHIFAAGFACVVLSNYFVTLGPTFLQQGIDALEHAASRAELHRIVIALLGVALAGGVTRFVMRQALNGVSRRVETDLRDRFFAQLQRLSAETYDRYPTGDLMARATNDLLAVRMVAGPAAMYLADTLTRATMVLPYLLHISPHLALMALLPLVALPAGMITFGRAIHRRTLRIQHAYSGLSTAVHENLAGVRIIRAYRQEPAEIGRFKTISSDYASRNLELARVSAAFHPLLTMLGGLGAAAVIWVGGDLVIQRTITIGEFVAFSTWLVYLVWPMISIGWVVNLVQRGEASMGRINALLDEVPRIVAPATPRALPAASAGRAVSFEQVWFRYPGGQDRGWVLEGVSFRIPAGRTLGITGPTGSGKSTIADLLVRAYDPTRGRILLDGIDIREIELTALHQAIGVVPQETFLFSDTVRGNILLGAPDDGRLERAGEISQFTSALPDLPAGYDTILGERGINLSGGQRQRAAIARALAQDPAVFVLDDSLSAVDAHTEIRILQGLAASLVSRTRIIISHRLSAIRDADEIIVLDEGKIVERGNDTELMALQGKYWNLLKRQRLEEEIEA